MVHLLLLIPSTDMYPLIADYKKELYNNYKETKSRGVVGLLEGDVNWNGGHSWKVPLSGHKLFPSSMQKGKEKRKWNRKLGIFDNDHYHHRFYTSIGVGVGEEGWNFLELFKRLIIISCFWSPPTPAWLYIVYRQKLWNFLENCSIPFLIRCFLEKMSPRSSGIILF